MCGKCGRDGVEDKVVWKVAEAAVVTVVAKETAVVTATVCIAIVEMEDRDK